MARETGSVLWRMALWDFLRKLLFLLLAVTCLVPVRRLPRPSRSMLFGDVSETRSDRVTRNAFAARNNEA